MNFLELQDAVLTDRFDESKRAKAKEWINHRYGRLWASEAWTFKIGLATYTVAAGASSVALGTIQRPMGFWDGTVTPNYSPMDAMRPEDFYNLATRTSAIPRGFTVIGDTIYFDSPMLSERTFTVLGELKWTELVADGNEPLLPEEFHRTLVHGAISEGLREEQDPSWQAEEEDFVQGKEDMKKAYLVSARTYSDVYPSWP